jgi:hypothetical protein
METNAGLVLVLVLVPEEPGEGDCSTPVHSAKEGRRSNSQAMIKHAPMLGKNKTRSGG